MTDGPLEIQTFTSRVFGQNAYLVRCRDGDDWLAVDPGGEAQSMAAAIESSGGRLDRVVLTHAHLDHIEGVAALTRRLSAPVLLHPADRSLYDAAPQQAAMFGHPVPPLPDPDQDLDPGTDLVLGTCRFEVRHAPGHSPGHVILYAPDAGVALVGDVIFAGSIGRTDLPGGSLETLMRSIREQVLTLPDETRLLTGHGPATTVGRERVANPFLRPNHPGSMA